MEADLNILRSLVTLLSFAGFLAIVVWAYSRRNRSSFDEAAQLPFLDEPALQANKGATHE
jgi:cytochrome c oxidase cbb3-type subunit 4